MPASDRFGNANQAYYFNGTSYLYSPGSLLNQIDNWTLVAWMNPASLSEGSGYVVCMGYDSGSAPSGNGYAFGNAGNQLEGFYGGVGPFSGGYEFPLTNRWYQIAMLRNSGTNTFYVNGVMTANSVSTTPIEPTAFSIGSASGIRFFNGAIDDVRVYSRALSSNEVQQLYAYESNPPNCASTATAVPTVVDGFVVGATITLPGCGYTNIPSVQILGGGGIGATATASVTNGQVTGITITDAGIGYTNTPFIYISSPIGAQIGLAQAVVPSFSDLLARHDVSVAEFRRSNQLD